LGLLLHQPRVASRLPSKKIGGDERK
jgi:hypothetical protein